MSTGHSGALKVVLLSVVVLALVASGLRPYDRLTWFLEVLPVLIAAPVSYTHLTLPTTILV